MELFNIPSLFDLLVTALIKHSVHLLAAVYPYVSIYF